MESFESNKEYAASECGSLSSYQSDVGSLASSQGGYHNRGGYVSRGGYLSDDECPQGERWPPLGANNEDLDDMSVCSFEELGRWEPIAYKFRTAFCIGFLSELFEFF